MRARPRPGDPNAADTNAADTDAASPDAVLVVRDLRRSFGDRIAVDGVSFGIARGETYGLLGPNGAGKTTTISMIAGVLTPNDGTVTVDGRAITPSAGAARLAIGLVPQDIALYPELSARENLVFFGRLQGMDRMRLRRRAAEVLAMVGLEDRADDRIDQFSGGMKRRANIAVGLLHEPSLLILDEPTVGVDPQSRNQILETIERLGDEGLAVLYTTHYMEEAQRLCHRIGIVDEGRLVAEGTRRELLATVVHTVHMRVGVDGDHTAFLKACGELDEVRAADADGAAVVLEVDSAARSVAAVVAAAESVGAVITELDVRESDLESVFLHLTGKALRD